MGHSTRSRWLLLLSLALIAGSIGAPIARGRATPIFSTPARPPLPPDTVVQPASAAPAAADLSLPPLKAVLLVGPIDGNTGTWTLQEVANMELAAAVLEAQGVTVHRFYPGSGTFTEIEQAAEGAQFLLYRGHGVYDGNLPYPNVGGFMLSSGYYSPDRIRQYMHLAPNAIVMLYGCFTAGSSSAEGDEYDIGIVEASRRVAQYSDPFFDVGAGGYYANWFGNAFEKFLQNLFAGQTLGQAYENYFDFNASTVYRTTHPNHPALAMWVDKDYWSGYWQYNNAFAGRASQTLEDLFPGVTLGNIPASLAFEATVVGGVQVTPATHSVTPTDISSGVDLTWVLSTSGNWFSVTPLSGATPQSFTITPQTFDTTRPGLYTGAITVTVTNPPETRQPVQRINLTLRVFAPELGNLPSQITFVYSNVTGEFMQSVYTLQPLNVGDTTPLAWQVATNSPWLQITPASGSTPQTFTLTAAGFDTTTVATYTGALTVTVTNPPNVYRSPHVLPVTLEVIDWTFSRVYLPLVARTYTSGR